MTLMPKPIAGQQYAYVSNEKAQILDDHTIGLFILEKDLIPGSKFNLKDYIYRVAFHTLSNR